MNIRNIVVGLIVLAIVVIAGYRLLPTVTDTKKVSKEPIKIGIIIYPGFGPFYIAQDKGFFEEEGVNADVTIIGDPTQLISSLASGDTHIIISSADFSTLVAQEIDIKEILATDIGYGSDGLLVTDEINKITDLQGKEIHLSLGTPSHFLFGYLAKGAGLSLNDFELIQMEADQVGTAFITKQVNYGMSWEPWLSKATEREDGKVLITSKTEPGIITDTIVARSDILEARHDDMKAVLRAWFKAIDFWRENPEEANAIMANHFGLPVEDFEAQVGTVKFLTYEENLEKFDESTNLNLYELTEKAVEIYREDGIIDSVINPDDIIDPSVLQGLYE